MKAKNFLRVNFQIIFLFLFVGLQQSLASEIEQLKTCSSHSFYATILNLKIYDIKLCHKNNETPTYKDIWNQDFAIVIKYSRDIPSEKLVDVSLDEIKKYNKISTSESEKISSKLKEIFPNVKKDDVISALYSKGVVTFEYNKKNVGKIEDKNFSKQFLNIWLHPNNEYKKMRLDLLKY